MADRIKRVIAGVAAFFTGEKLIIGKEGIISILPHRGRMLLLDEVVITDSKVVGKFEVTEEICRGHEFNGQLIFRGIDMVEMAAQTLGIWAYQHSEFQGKLAFFRSVQGVKFKDKVIPGSDLAVEIPVEENNPRIEISGRMPDRLIQRIIGENITAFVDKKLKVEISGIELVIVDLPQEA